MTLWPANQLAQAVELQIAPLKAIAETVEQGMRPRLLLAETLQPVLFPYQPIVDFVARQATVNDLIADQYGRNIAPILASTRTWASVMPVPTLVSSQVFSYLDGWRELVAIVLMPMQWIASEVAQWLHEALIEAAERAFDALVNEPDPRRRAAVVRRFAERWIGVGKQHPAHLEARLEAVHDVLLSACWRETGIGSPVLLQKHLRHQVRETAKVHRPLWRNEIAGRPITLLSQPRGYTATGDPILLEDIVPDPGDRPAALVDRLGMRQQLGSLLAQLSAEQRHIALIKHHDDGITWDAAARLAGLPVAAGESTRRKLRRLAQEVQRRRTPSASS